jgi:hypothetical protein
LGGIRCLIDALFLLVATDREGGGGPRKFFSVKVADNFF